MIYLITALLILSASISLDAGKPTALKQYREIIAQTAHLRPTTKKINKPIGTQNHLKKQADLCELRKKRDFLTKKIERINGQIDATWITSENRPHLSFLRKISAATEKEREEVVKKLNQEHARIFEHIAYLEYIRVQAQSILCEIHLTNNNDLHPDFRESRDADRHQRSKRRLSFD